MASFHCYDNSDVIATLIITNFHLYLIQLGCQSFQIFVYGDVVCAQTWEVLTLKNCIEPPSILASEIFTVGKILYLSADHHAGWPLCKLWEHRSSVPDLVSSHPLPPLAPPPACEGAFVALCWNRAVGLKVLGSNLVKHAFFSLVFFLLILLLLFFFFITDHSFS